MKNLKSHIKSLRNDYTAGVLDEKNVSKSPFKQFEKWLHEAVESQVDEPNAMTLATSAKDGSVDARIVLLRHYSTKGFSFFTNYNSIKGRAIRYNKKVCLNFFWPDLNRQVRIKGTVIKLSSRTSDNYFNSRPRESQIAAWASHQSEKMTNRNELMERYNTIEEKYTGKKVPRPDFWGGFLVIPVHFEFWQGRVSRLHDRVSYEKSRNEKWSIARLNP